MLVLKSGQWKPTSQSKQLILILASAGNNTARKTACSKELVAHVVTQIFVSLMKA